MAIGGVPRHIHIAACVGWAATWRAAANRPRRSPVTNANAVDTLFTPPPAPLRHLAPPAASFMSRIVLAAGSSVLRVASSVQALAVRDGGGVRAFRSGAARLAGPVAGAGVALRAVSSRCGFRMDAHVGGFWQAVARLHP